MGEHPVQPHPHLHVQTKGVIGAVHSTYLRFDVTMQNLAVMDVLQSQAQLDKPVQDLEVQ